MIKLKDMLEDLEFGKVYTDKDRPPFEVNESRANVLKAIKIAKNMGGDMTGAVKKIEKIQKGLSKQIEVEDALRKANESVNEDILTEAMSDAEIKKMHKKYKDTGELPPHLKKMLKGKKDFEKKFKVKNIVVPGLEWMADIDEAKTASIDGEELMNFLMKRFKMSKKKAIDTMKKHKMDTSFIKEARTINVEPNWEGMWRFFKQMAITNPRDWKRMERTLGSDWKKIDAMAKKNKWTESVNEAIEPSGIMAKINKIVQSKQAAKIDGVLMDMFSASIMMRIFNAVNDKSKKDMNKGTMRQVKVILHKVMKQNKVRESVNESAVEVGKIIKYLMKKGDTKNTAVDKIKQNYAYVSKKYKSAPVAKKAEILTSLQEGSCGYGIDGKVGKEPAGPHLLKKKKKKYD